MVGGTGLYISSIINKNDFGESSNDPEFRKKCEDIVRAEGKEKLFDLLKEKSSAMASKTHANNVQRVIRYLEILEHAKNENVFKKAESDYDYRLIVLRPDREDLYDRINERVEKMFDLGLEEEVKSVIEKFHLNESSQSMKAIGYKEFFPYINGDIDLIVLKENIKQNSRKYAKRQYTYLNQYSENHIIDIENAEKIYKKYKKL